MLVCEWSLLEPPRNEAVFVGYHMASRRPGRPSHNNQWILQSTREEEKAASIFVNGKDPVRVWLMCEPASWSREPRVASLFLRATAFFFSYLFIYFVVFWHFQFNVNVFLSKWGTWQKKHKFSIFFRAWNSAQVVSVVCWRSFYSFRPGLNVAFYMRRIELPN